MKSSIASLFIREIHRIAVRGLVIVFACVASLSGLADTVAAGSAASRQANAVAEPAETRVTQVAQAESEQAKDDDNELEEIVVTGSQIRGAAISDALAVSVFTQAKIEALGVSSGDELLDFIPEQGQNFFNEAENISGGVNSARGDIGAFNLRNMGTGNTLVLVNGRRMVAAAGYQTEVVGGSFVPVTTYNSNALPVFGVDRVEILRDGASAIYGADAVAGVVNTVLKNDFEGFSLRLRYDEYDHLPRNDQRINIEWGRFFNGGRTNLGIYADFYHRDRINSQDDDKWSDSDYRRLIPAGSPWEGNTRFRNTSANSNFGQFDMSGSVSGITDGSGEFETYPMGDARCDGGWQLNEVMCGHADGQGTYRYNLWGNNVDLASELDRYNFFGYLNHDFDNGVQAYSEFSYYQAKTNLNRHPSASFSSVKLVVGAENYYNPFGPCGSPNRLPDEIIGADFPCEGKSLLIDNYRYTEVPRIVDTKNETWRLLQGFRGTMGEWDWDAALLYSKAERNDVTHNRISNTLMQEALNDPTPAAYNPFNGGVLPSNIDRALVDVYRNNQTDLKLIDFKVSRPDLFNLWAGPVGFLAGVEYREESFKDNRDPRLDGTIVFTDNDGDTFPLVGDVVNSSPSSDSRGGRDVTSVFAELAIPLHSTLNVQAALRYENFSDTKSTTVGKVAFGWRPVEPLLIRGSWSQAFRAPNLVTINENLVVRNNTRNDYACFFVDPDEDILDCRYAMQRRAQGSQNLDPEESTNTSIGAVWNITEGLTVSLDFWTIEKEDTIGLFGEENHTILDLLLRIEAGLGNCDQVFNPAVSRNAPDDDQIAIYTAAGICPGGDIEFIDDRYANLDTRTVEGYDIGIYWDVDTRVGDFSFSYNGSFYETYEQEPGGAAKVLLAASEAGTIPQTIPVAGFDDLLGLDGNQDEKHTASITWRNDNWAARVSGNKLGSFYQSSLTLSDGTKYIIPSMTTFNLSADYNFDLWKSRSRVRLGVNNFTDERAPLADRYFGYFADAHRDFGRYYYLDLRFRFD